MSEYHGKSTVAAWNGQTIGEVLTIGALGSKTDIVDVTTFADTYKQYLLGHQDVPEITITGNFDPGDTDGQVAFLTDKAAGTSRTLLITLPTAMATTFSVTALPTGFEILPKKDGAVEFSFTVKPTGAPTLGITASAGITTPFLTASTGVIAPTAAQATLEYVIDVPTGTTSITLTPTAAAGVITITANGVDQVVTSGVASSAITLGAAGSITNITVSVKETGKMAKNYEVHVYRPAA